MANLFHSIFRTNSLISVIAATAALTLSSCFTGVESTPKITKKDIKRHKVEQTVEQKYLADIAPEQPANWKPGKTFYVTDNRASLVYSVSDNAPIDSMEGRALTLTSIGSRRAFTGDDIMVFDFIGNDGRRYTYTSSLTDVKFETQSTLSIPFTIEMSVVDSIQSRLVGRSVYLKERRRYDAKGASHDGQRYNIIKILNVDPSNDPDRLRVWFKDLDGVERYVLMNTDTSRHSTRAFDNVFDFDNPRDQYPSISDESWALIKDSRVTKGMTPDECRLALGSPTTLRRVPSTAGMIERWSYDDGQYLIFEDGVLIDFRI